jgi:hypothetical protein
MAQRVNTATNSGAMWPRARYRGMFSDREVLDYWNKDDLVGLVGFNNWWLKCLSTWVGTSITG